MLLKLDSQWIQVAEVTNKPGAAKITQMKDSYLERTLAPGQSYFCLSMIDSGLFVQESSDQPKDSFCREAPVLTESITQWGIRAPCQVTHKCKGTSRNQIKSQNHGVFWTGRDPQRSKHNFWLPTGHAQKCYHVPEGMAQMLLELCLPWCCDYFPGESVQSPITLWVKRLESEELN